MKKVLLVGILCLGFGLGACQQQGAPQTDHRPPASHGSQAPSGPAAHTSPNSVCCAP